MRVNDTEAAQRVAEHENLVGELVIHLRATAHMLRSACMVISDKETRQIALGAVRDAEALIKRAEGATA